MNQYQYAYYRRNRTKILERERLRKEQLKLGMSIEEFQCKGKSIKISQNYLVTF
jgi:hypothetical protein